MILPPSLLAIATIVSNIRSFCQYFSLKSGLNSRSLDSDQCNLYFYILVCQLQISKSLFMHIYSYILYVIVRLNADIYLDCSNRIVNILPRFSYSHIVMIIVIVFSRSFATYLINRGSSDTCSMASFFAL